jgi:hypothetical protein
VASERSALFDGFGPIVETRKVAMAGSRTITGGSRAVKWRRCRVARDSEILAARLEPVGGGTEAVTVGSKLVIVA